MSERIYITVTVTSDEYKDSGVHTVLRQLCADIGFDGYNQYEVKRLFEQLADKVAPEEAPDVGSV